MSDDLKDPKHTKIKRFEKQPDGSERITTESYYKDLSSRKTEVSRTIPTNKDSFLADLVSATDVVLNKQTNELTLHIQLNEDRTPKRITKTYLLMREDFGRR